MYNERNLKYMHFDMFLVLIWILGFIIIIFVFVMHYYTSNLPSDISG